MRATTEQIELFAKAFEMCNVKAGETVVVLSDPNRRERTHLGQYADASIKAVQSLGADAFEIIVPHHAKGGAGRSGYGESAHGSAVVKTPLTGLDSAIEVLKSADMVIDLMLLLHSPEQIEILESGTRMLLIQEPMDMLKRLFPSEEVKKRVKEAEEILQGAKEMHLTSPGGTDCRFVFGDYPRLTIQHGYTEEPGGWDHWPSALVAAYPNDEGTEGTLVFDRGDILFPLKRYVQEPVKLTIKDGFITDIEGGTDAILLKEYIDSWNDPDGYGTAHVGWGLDPRAIWSSLELMDRRSMIGMEHRSAAGSIMYSSGPNVDGGGPRNTPAHCDMTMLGCTLTVDGRTVVKDGELV